MEIRITEDVTTEPVALSLVKDYCRIDADYTGEDATLTLLQASAREMLERFLNLSLAPKQIEIQYSGGYLQLPYGPHTSVVSVKDMDGNEIPEDKYSVRGMDFLAIDTNGTGYSFFYPVDCVHSPIIEPIGGFNGSGANIIVNVGYTSEKLKSGLKLIILRLVDYLYQNRGSKVSDIPLDVREDAAVYSRNSIL